MTARTLSLAVAALLLVACGAPDQAGAAAPQSQPAFPALTGRVVDQAELLSSGEETQLASELEALERRTSDQVVVVTLSSLEGRTIEEYSLALADHWGIGQPDKDNGVLLVVVPSERVTRIEIGFGLGPILTEERAREIVNRDLVPNFHVQRWSEGIFAGARAIVAILIEREREPRRGQP